MGSVLSTSPSHFRCNVIIFVSSEILELFTVIFVIVSLPLSLDTSNPTFVDKLTHLFFCVCKFHSFEDGNKRLAITLSVQFLLINGYLSVAQTFFRETENISYHVAAGHIDKDLLHDILDSIMRGNFEEDEDVKLRYYTVIAEE